MCVCVDWWEREICCFPEVCKKISCVCNVSASEPLLYGGCVVRRMMWSLEDGVLGCMIGAKKNSVAALGRLPAEIWTCRNLSMWCALRDNP